MTGKKSFTFVELMVTVVILMSGLILIIQGFVTAAGAFNTAQNYIQVLQFLDAKMQETESLAGINDGIKREDVKDNFSFGPRTFDWELRVFGVEKTEEPDLSEDLNKVILSVSWTERNYPKKLSLETLLKNKKE
ncbi:MAG: hypothetical protein A3K83_01910 [Omnitrophica WOR_2 bacterium RBG_13_44_8b]|nr:MAG: hypothetical protein A3K83_01910 [Omnitrophica WOR_2 bacterium RBG_13_44_8b]